MSQLLRNEYMVDTDEELVDKIDMIAHNYGCQKNILANPEKFPRANFDYIEQLNDEHFLFLAGRLHPVILNELRAAGEGAKP